MSIWAGKDWHEFDSRAWWSTRSVKDPRFNMDGGSSGVISAGMDADSAIKAKGRELGIEPPDDIEMSGGKN